MQIGRIKPRTTKRGNPSGFYDCGVVSTKTTEIVVELYISFFLASVLLALTPGPDNVFVLVQSLAQGARAGVVITLGLCSGLVVHTALVALGVAELIRQSQWALPLLALFGAGYLSYLAWMSWQAGLVRVNKNSQDANQRKNHFGPLYRRGVIMNLTNPKVLLFFLAFLPQFVRGDEAVAQQIFMLGGVFIVAALLVFCSIALACVKIQPVLNSGAGQLWLNRVVALVFAGLALRLIWVAVGLLTATH